MKKNWYVVLLLLIFTGLAIGSMLTTSATSDEVTHITSGYSYLTHFDYTFNPEHPPLGKLWAALPLLLVNPSLETAPSDYEGDQWAYAKYFLYESGNDADVIYFWSRLMIVMLGVLLGYYIWRWASELFGWKAGLLALILYVFDPNFLAHSGVVHTDVAISAMMFITVYYFWKFVGQREGAFTNKQIGVLGILLGLCLSVKFTGLYVIGILAVLYVVHLFFDRFAPEEGQDWAKQIKAFVTGLVKDHAQLRFGIIGIGIAVLVGFVVLVVTYGFVHIGSFISGMQNVMEQSVFGRTGYLLGAHSTQGWWYYFFVTFFVKTPTATLVLFFAALFFVGKKLQTRFDRKELRTMLFLLIPAVLYFVAFIPSKYNIGHRHILPIYPFLFVFISALTTLNYEELGFPKIAKWGKQIALFLVAFLIVSTVFAFPYYISFFNIISGGSSNGHTYVLDSNIDWGQSLKETATWLDEQGHLDDTIRMTYFGNEEPSYRGITSNRIMCNPTPGIHVISINRLYDFLGNQYGCTDWLFDYEPIEIIGYSMYVYNIDDPELIEKDALCKQNCVEGCMTRGDAYGDSAYKAAEDGCLCLCAEATNEDLGIL